MVPLTDSQVLIVWRKDLGLGYNFKVTVTQGQTEVKTIQGPTGFGNSKAVVVNGLQSGINYDFATVHECASKPGTFSAGSPKAGKTFDKGIPYPILVQFFH